VTRAGAVDSTSDKVNGIEPEERLRYRSQFEAAYNDGRRLICRLFVGFVIFRPDGPFRFGVVASRRVGGAVRRNRAKRLLREVFRRNKPKASVSGDLVLVARAPIVRARYGDVEADFAKSIGRFLETGS